MHQCDAREGTRQRAGLPGNSDGCFSFTSYPGKVFLRSICRGRAAGCRAVILTVMWVGCHLSRSLKYFSKCTPQLQLLLGYMEWRFRVLPRATNSGFLSSLQGICIMGNYPVILRTTQVWNLLNSVKKPKWQQSGSSVASELPKDSTNQGRVRWDNVPRGSRKAASLRQEG